VAAHDRERLSRNASLVLLAALLATAAAVLLGYGHDLTFFQDTWEFLMHRRSLSADAILEPHNEHIVLIPVLVNQALLRVFGMSSMVPELVALVLTLLGTAALVFVYARRRLGPWAALIATALLLFLGPAWQDLLWPFQIGFAGSSLFGMAMLLALENEDERWDRAACAFLALSIAFSSLGLAFAVAAAVGLLQQRRRGGLRRAWIVVAPLALYAVWWLGWGHNAENHLSAHNVLVSPRYVWEGLSASLDSLLALGTIAGEVVGRSQYGAPLLIVLLALAAYGGYKRRGFHPGLWPVLAAAATFWFLAAFNTIPGREPYSSRYLYVGGLFAILIAVNLLQGLRFNRWGLLAAAAVTAVVVGFNLTPLREGRDFFRSQTVLTRSDLGAIEIAERTVEPSFGLPPEIAGTPYLNEIEAGNYLEAEREYGSPAYSPGELARAPEAGRVQADLVLANALPLGIETTAGTGSGHGCTKVAGRNGAAPLSLRPGTTTIELGPGGTGTVSLRRFATGSYPLVSEGVPASSTTRLYIPRDKSIRPWQLLVEAPQGAHVCQR
jgi:MFS family permease